MKFNFMKKPDFQTLISQAGDVRTLVDVNRVIKGATRPTWTGRAARFGAMPIKQIADALERGAKSPQFVKDEQNQTEAINAARKFRMAFTKINCP